MSKWKKDKRCCNRQTVSLIKSKIRCVQPKHGFDPQLARFTVFSIYKQLGTIAKQTLKKRNQKSQKMLASQKKSQTIAIVREEWDENGSSKTSTISLTSILITALFVTSILGTMVVDIVVKIQTWFSVIFSNLSVIFPPTTGYKKLNWKSIN